VPSVRVRQSEKNAWSTQVHGYVEKGVGSDWLSEKVMLANRVSGS
jgi:hypothetical protein